MLYFIDYSLGNLFRLVFTILLAPFSRAARYKLIDILGTLRYPFYGNKHVDLSNLLSQPDEVITIGPVKSKEHNVTAIELFAICALIKDNAASNVFEIGTFDGRTTRAIAMNIDNDGHVYTLNLPDNTASVQLTTSSIDVGLASKVKSGEQFLKTAENAKITQLWGDSAVFDFAPYFGQMDAVFIDGAHSSEYVKNDTIKSLKLIKPDGGIIIWHDAHLYGVVKFLRTWIKQHNYPIYFIKNTSLAVAFVKNGLPTPFDGR